jgi:dolichyl-phosphate-mannose-protein mannosyltransferase
MKAAAILFGVTFFIATSWALGAILLRKLAVTLYRVEERLLGFMVGSACLSALVFALAAMKLVHKGILLSVGAAAIGYAIYSGAYRPQGKDFPKLAAAWKWLFGTVFTAFTVLYFFNAMAPEISPDGMAYHLSFVAKYARAHGFVRIPENMYAHLSQGIELLFLFAFEFGKHSAASLVHYSFLLAVTFLMVCYGRRIGYPGAGVAGALFFYASPVVGQDAVIAYNDVAVAAILFTLYYLLQVWDEDKNAKLLVPIGILAGFSYAAKYTAFLAVPYALAFVLWKLLRAKRPFVKPVLVTASLALMFILPWMTKNWLWVDNPISPFGNRIFPNRYVHVSFEDDYRKFERIYSLTSYKEIPLQITVHGDKLTGFFGPLFLLTPLALLALRFRPGRQLLLAAVIFALPYYGNIGTRFLIPAAPFVSLALALALANLRWLLLALAAAHAVLSLPGIERLYCSPVAWRIDDIPYRAALRIEAEGTYLFAHSAQYREGMLIEQKVPQGEKVFALGNSAESYISRDMVVKYEGARNEVLGDILWIPMFHLFQPAQSVEFHFAPQALRKLRLVQTARSPVIWSIHEFRVFSGGKELPRDPAWRLTAKPNPWDVQLAFDNSPVTRWRSWQAMEPGMFVEVDFGRAQQVDAVEIQTSEEVEEGKIKLVAADESGTWSPLGGEPKLTRAPYPMDLRYTATRELKARGIRYLLVGGDDIRSDDYIKHARLWGIKKIGEMQAARLYRIE